MPGAVRKGDMSAGHPHCYPATPAVGCSSDVIINGLPACRIGDSISCGDTMAEGSSDVIIGD